MPEQRYEIAFRTGGVDNHEWHIVLDRFTSDEATAKASEIERMGYKTKIGVVLC